MWLLPKFHIYINIFFNLFVRFVLFASNWLGQLTIAQVT